MHDPQQRGGRQGVEAQLPVRDVGRRRLLGRARFHALAAAGAISAARVITGNLHLGGDDVLDHTLVILDVDQAGVAAGTGFCTRRVHRQRHLLVSIDMIGHGPQRRGMPLLAARLFVSWASDGGFDKSGRRLVLRGRRGEFFVLLFQAAILRLEFFDPLLERVVALVGKVPFPAIMIAIGAEELVLAPQKLHFLCALIV